MWCLGSGLRYSRERERDEASVTTSWLFMIVSLFLGVCIGSPKADSGTRVGRWPEAPDWGWEAGREGKEAKCGGWGSWGHLRLFWETVEHPRTALQGKGSQVFVHQFLIWIAGLPWAQAVSHQGQDLIELSTWNSRDQGLWMGHRGLCYSRDTSTLILTSSFLLFFYVFLFIFYFFYVYAFYLFLIGR